MDSAVAIIAIFPDDLEPQNGAVSEGEAYLETVRNLSSDLAIVAVDLAVAVAVDETFHRVIGNG